ncbi:MAG: sigma-70 family RNA polymerase sigma factor [Armatimonadetes bacterium]|nr:sigma-70 family RNA polymerase sigma factor [Armatimonadota bacterium]
MRLNWLRSAKRWQDTLRGETSPEDRRRNFETEVLAAGESLYRHALRLTHNADDADDLLQDTLSRAYQNFDRFQTGTNFKAWILRIMTNLFINRRRQQAREPVLESLDAEEEGFSLYERLLTESFDGAGFEIRPHQGGVQPHQGKNPEDLVLEKLGEEAIKAAINSLPEDYQLVVGLVDLDGLSYEEASAVLKVPMGTVRSRLHRGRTILQRKLYNYAKEMNYI